jgi:hypothetical protein
MSPDQLREAGISVDDIRWMADNGGYTGGIDIDSWLSRN